MDALAVYNTIAWVTSNILVLTIFVSATAFVILYPLFFRFEATTAGILIWRAVLSFALIAALSVIGLFVDGRVDWWVLPIDVAWWRPTVRLVVFGFIAYTFGSLVGLVIVRRFWPSRVKIHPEGWVPVPARSFHRKG